MNQDMQSTQNIELVKPPKKRKPRRAKGTSKPQPNKRPVPKIVIPGFGELSWKNGAWVVSLAKNARVSFTA